MSDGEPETARTTRSAGRTVVLLLAWVAAALVAGVPSGAGAANTKTSATKNVPVVVNSGPECFAGHAPAATNPGN
jgi:hypothetical protein